MPDGLASCVPFDEAVVIYLAHLLERGRGVELGPGRMTLLAPMRVETQQFVRLQFHLPNAGELDVDAVVVECTEDAKHRFVYRLEFLRVDPDVELAIRHHMNGWLGTKTAPPRAAATGTT